MTDSDRLIKTIVAIGVLSTFVTLLITPQASNPIPAREGYTQQVSPWNLLTTTLQNGFNLPTFNNPFDERFEVDLRIVGDGNDSAFGHPATATDTMGTVPSCTNATEPLTDYFGCVNTPDGVGSYASTNGACCSQFAVNLSAAGGVAVGLPVLSIRTTVQCNSASPVEFDYLFYKSDDTTLISEVPTDPIQCAAGWADVTTYSYFDTPYKTVGDYSNGRVKFHPTSAPFAVSFSYLRVSLVYGVTQECTSGDTLTYIGCILAGFTNWLVRFGRFLALGFIFILQVVYVVGLFILQVIAGLFLGVIGTLLFFMNPANTGHPPAAAQSVMTMALITMVASMFYLIVKLLRGGGGGP